MFQTISAQYDEVLHKNLRVGVNVFVSLVTGTLKKHRSPDGSVVMTRVLGTLHMWCPLAGGHRFKPRSG